MRHCGKRTRPVQPRVTPPMNRTGKAVLAEIEDYSLQLNLLPNRLYTESLSIFAIAQAIY